MTAKITIHPEAAYDNLSPYQATKAQAPTFEGELFGKDGLAFNDILDSINPLQHLPGISTAYQMMTGDNKISTGASLIGGAIFGGPIGFAMALANEIFQSATGHGVGGAMLAAITGESEKEIAWHEEGPPATNRNAYEAYKLRQGLSA